MNRRMVLVFSLVLIVSVLSVFVVDAQGPRPGMRAPRTALGTGFTYQGQIKNNGALVNGTCDLAFRLYDDVAAGTQIGSPITQTIVITNGLFTTQVNTGNEFGANAFSGDARWLEIRVSNACPSGGTFTTLNPREPISPAPYALTSLYTAYKNVLVVTTSGGRFNSITAALNSITDNSATNRYLIFVAPGTYTETVTMKQYVDIEGAGELMTKIAQVGNANNTTGTIVGADNAELRFLTAENTGGSVNAIAIYNNSASPRLTHVTVIGSGASLYNHGVFNFNSSSPTMTNVIASASGGANTNYGVLNNQSSPTMINVTTIASGATNENYGVNNDHSSPSMTNVTASASGGANTNYGVLNTYSSPTMTNVTASASAGTNTFGVNNDHSSPMMTNVTASGSGATNYNQGVGNSVSSVTMTNVTASAFGASNYNFGINNSASSLTLANVTASALGGSGNNWGVYNYSTPLTMTNVTAFASGTGAGNRGVYNYSSSTLTIQNSVINANGGTNDIGIHNTGLSSGTYTQTVNNSQVHGSANTILNGPNFITLVGASKLDGGPVSGVGTVTCAGVYDENYTFYANTCP